MGEHKELQQIHGVITPELYCISWYVEGFGIKWQTIDYVYSGFGGGSSFYAMSYNPIFIWILITNVLQLIRLIGDLENTTVIVNVKVV